MSQADIVNTWFREKIGTGEIARYTPAYNQAFAAKDDLIERLEAEAPSGAPKSGEAIAESKTAAPAAPAEE